ncbi:class I SAM-dependent methyltransferase [Sphingosinithalassobacter sp. CS137]|uniref:class I SAM-dependent methyltransferase n=1 Tax=Sphingosinithalassobacter sp. CS137 TaxID=2762748 RepID=UPI00165D9D25|nr:class I SAM-dependent methyltransferase [Sphingosinithalassobacter sp. CS137]
MPDRIAEHYERHAQRFDRARRRAFPEREWLDRFLLPLPRHAHVLDLGCGAGEPVARYMIDAGHQLTGVDVSERMIALARTRFPRHRWLRTDMRAATMDRGFDGVLAWDSLFHLPPNDQAAMITRIAGWLEPGGVFLFNSGPARSECIGSQFGDALYHASLAPEEYRALFDETGLLEIAYAPEDEASGGRSVWLTRKER